MHFASIEGDLLCDFYLNVAKYLHYHDARLSIYASKTIFYEAVKKSTPKWVDLKQQEVSYHDDT